MSEGCRSWETTASRARASNHISSPAQQQRCELSHDETKAVGWRCFLVSCAFPTPCTLAARKTPRPRPPFPREQAKARRLVERRCVVVRTAARSLFVVSCFFFWVEYYQAMISLNTSHRRWPGQSVVMSLRCFVTNFFLAQIRDDASFSNRRLPLTLCTLALYSPSPRATRSWIPA